MQLTHDGWGPNIGVMFVRPTDAALTFMSTWRARRTAPDSRDQYEFAEAVNQTQGLAPLVVEYLDKGRFPNGCCCGYQLPRHKHAARQWVLWHAACVAGSLQSKAGVLERIERAAVRLHPPAPGSETCRRQSNLT